MCVGPFPIYSFCLYFNFNFFFYLHSAFWGSALVVMLFSYHFNLTFSLFKKKCFAAWRVAGWVLMGFACYLLFIFTFPHSFFCFCPFTIPVYILLFAHLTERGDNIHDPTILRVVGGSWYNFSFIYFFSTFCF